MSARGRPKRELLPLGGTARSAKGAPVSAPGRPKRELLPLGGTARSARVADSNEALDVKSALAGLHAQALDQMALPLAAAAKLDAYLALLAKWNRTYNLTAIREPSRMITHHVLDALAVLPHLPQRATLRLLDVGSGGGVPGIPLAIARPDWRVVLLDGSHKKGTFLAQAVIELALANAEAVTSRIEDYAPWAPFDVVVSRAFSDLATFARAALPHLASGGSIVAMKGVYPDEEIAELPAGVRVVAAPALSVPGLDAQRHLIVMKRHAPE